MESIDKYLDDDNCSPVPCPRCGAVVEAISSRDVSILQTYMQCTNPVCPGEYFLVTSHINLGSDANHVLGVTDFEISAVKYYHWATSENAHEGYRGVQQWD